MRLLCLCVGGGPSGLAGSGSAPDQTVARWSAGAHQPLLPTLLLSTAWTGTSMTGVGTSQHRNTKQWRVRSIHCRYSVRRPERDPSCVHIQWPKVHLKPCKLHRDDARQSELPFPMVTQAPMRYNGTKSQKISNLKWFSAKSRTNSHHSYFFGLQDERWESWLQLSCEDISCKRI